MHRFSTEWFGDDCCTAIAEAFLLSLAFEPNLKVASGERMPDVSCLQLKSKHCDSEYVPEGQAIVPLQFVFQILANGKGSAGHPH
jgi:hypothetical protein